MPFIVHWPISRLVVHLRTIICQSISSSLFLAVASQFLRSAASFNANPGYAMSLEATRQRLAQAEKVLNDGESGCSIHAGIIRDGRLGFGQVELQSRTGELTMIEFFCRAGGRAWEAGGTGRTISSRNGVRSDAGGGSGATASQSDGVRPMGIWHCDLCRSGTLLPTHIGKVLLFVSFFI